VSKLFLDQELITIGIATTRHKTLVVFVRATFFKKPKAPSFQMGSGWNLTRLFLK